MKTQIYGKKYAFMSPLSFSKQSKLYKWQIAKC